MDNTLFYKSFSFRLISHSRTSHTDNTHGIDRNFLARMICGTGRIVCVDGEELLVREGDVFFLPIGLCYHSYWTPSKRRGKVEWESYGFELYPDKDGRRLRMQKLMLTKDMEAMLDSLSSHMRTDLSSVGTLYSFLGKAMPHMSAEQTVGKHPLLVKAERYISEHPDMRVPELARHCGMSESGLYAFFKEHAGETPVDLKNRILVKRASELLGTTDMSVEQIGERLGFSSVAYFRKIVRDLTGKTPTEIRREQAAKYRL